VKFGFIAYAYYIGLLCDSGSVKSRPEIYQEAEMPIGTLFTTQLILGYVAWLLCFGAYGLPKLRSMDRVEAHRAIATLHSFRFFGLVFIVSGVVGPDLPAGFAPAAAYGDFATGVMAMLALITVRVRPVFWVFVIAFNLVGTGDLVIDYWHAVQSDLPNHAGALGAAYVIPVLYVPLLMITHGYVVYDLAWRRRSTVSGRPTGAAASL
jgi:hypothetical protein